MAKTKIGSNATFSGAQLGLTTIGKDHCYAYSGAQVSNGGVDATLLSFTQLRFDALLMV